MAKYHPDKLQHLDEAYQGRRKIRKVPRGLRQIRQERGF